MRLRQSNSRTPSVTYVVWTIRGGYMRSSLMALMPSWQFVDPLPILDVRDEDESDSDDEDAAESLEALVGQV